MATYDDTVAGQIQRLQDDKTAIKTAITNKGVTVASTASYDDFASLIGSISTGSSISAVGSTTSLTTGAVVLYNQTVKVSSTSTTSSAIITVSGLTLSKYDSILMAAIPLSASTTAGSFVRSCGSVIKTSSSYPSIEGGKYTYINSSGTTTTSTISSSGYGIYPYQSSSTTIQIRTRCSSIYCTSISGTFRIILIGISYS